MKEIKAYVRSERIGAILARLDDSGAKAVTVIRVEAIGAMADPEKDSLHLFRKYTPKYAETVKLEIVCYDDEAQAFVEIIQEAAHTGRVGDGRIFLSDVQRVVNIRTGAVNEGAL